jgi:L-threonylcarbamoyladenylate synthase
MQTRIFSPSEVHQAAQLLKSGEIVAFPTETVYGLGANAFSLEAVQKIYSVKKRPSDNPLIVHLSHLSDIERLAIEVPNEFYLLAEVFFPGPLTVVLKRNPKLPSIICAGLNSVAVRMPAHPIAIELISAVGDPLVAPSANISGKPSSTQLKHVLQDFQGKISGVIDGGDCPLGIESSVLNLIDPASPKLLRPGEITVNQIEKVLRKKISSFEKERDSSQSVCSPGMKYRHYAPSASVRLFSSFLKLSAYLASAPPLRRMLLASQKIENHFLFCDSFSLSNQTLYHLLRQADEKKYEEVIVFCDDKIISNQALMNRLTRAAEK